MRARTIAWSCFGVWLIATAAARVFGADAPQIRVGPGALLAGDVRDARAQLAKFTALREATADKGAVTEAWSEVASSNPETSTWTRTVEEISWVGDRFKARVMDWHDLTGKNAPAPESRARVLEYVWSGERWYMYHQTTVKPAVRTATTFEDRDAYIGGGMRGDRLDGVVPGDPEPFDRILAGYDDLSLASEGGFRVISGHGTRGSYQVWLDPAHGFALHKIDVRKVGDDLYDRHTINAIPKPLPRGVRLPPGMTQDPPWQEVRFHLEVTEYREFRGHPVAVRASSDSSTAYEGGAVARAHTVYERTNLRATDPDTQLRLDAPDGTPVLDTDRPGISLAWRNGQIVQAGDNSR